MQQDQVYAIVDIEATGGSIGADERIIQIAIILMKNNEVITTFDSYVNPGRSIPRNITKLTGIRNKDVRTAPYFEEIAPIVIRLLDDAIFVAHNVGFDYRFLNEQLHLHDFERLDIPAIDTVELTQILYPTLDSYQLEEIASFLGHDLLEAHDALADAEATVHIFEGLFQRAIQLPLVTLEKLVELAECTTHQTYLFFQTAFEHALTLKAPLADDLVIVNQIALRKPKPYIEQPSSASVLTYPATKAEKLTYLNGEHTYREAQAEMMNLVHEYFQTELSLEKLAIEAPPGIGKSIGYLFPATFTARQGQPVVVSTYTTVLQNQLLEKTMVQLEDALHRKINAVLVKSSQHYLSLSVFERWLKETKGIDSEAYLCMRILVWLTDTESGDLTEINAGSHLDLEFWRDIRVTKNQHVDDHWREFEFYERIKEASKLAEIIVTNHHFLVHDWQSDQPILPNLNHLIIDEAHHFPEVALRSSTVDLSSQELFIQLEKMGSLSNETGINKLLSHLFDQNVISINDLKILNRTVQSINGIWTNLMESLIETFLTLEPLERKDSIYTELEFDLEILTLRQKRWVKNVLRATEEFLHVSQNILNTALKLFNDLNNEHQLTLIELGDVINFLSEWRNKVIQILKGEKGVHNALRWVNFLPEDPERTLQFHLLKWGEENSLIDYLAIHSKVVFTSSTLSYQNSEYYFSEQLKNLPLQFHQLESPFNYGEQVRVMLPEKRIHPRKVSPEEYAPLLAETIGEILKDTKTNSIVLFRSLGVLREVYELLMDNEDLMDHLILAQSISGTRNRIIKNFKRNKPAVILGADSFFEGIDLPDEELELLILTRLPFPAPNTPITRLKTSHLEEQKINPFLGEFLPQAVLKFRQAFGRLIRKKTDKGVMVILDDRFISANYSDIFKNALPQGVDIEIFETEQLSGEIQAFIDSEKSDIKNS